MLPKRKESPKSVLTLGALALLIAQGVIAQTASLGGAGANSNATPMIGLPNPDAQRGGAPYTPRDCSQAPDPGRCLARQQYMQNRQGGMGGGMQGQQGNMPPGQGMGRPQGPGGMNGGMPGMGMGGMGGQGGQQGGMPGGQGHPPRDCSQAPDPGRCQARQQQMQNQQGGMGGMQGQQGGMPPGQGMGRPQGGMPPGQGMGRPQGGMPPGQGMGRPQGGMPPGQGMQGQQGGMPPGQQHHRPN